MIEELLENATGPVGVGILLLLAFPGGRQAARATVKTLVRTGVEISDYFRDIYDEVEEERKFYGTARIQDRARAR